MRANTNKLESGDYIKGPFFSKESLTLLSLSLHCCSKFYIARSPNSSLLGTSGFGRDGLGLGFHQRKLNFPLQSIVDLVAPACLCMLDGRKNLKAQSSWCKASRWCSSPQLSYGDLPSLVYEGSVAVFKGTA
jgi:hypothetical protein